MNGWNFDIAAAPRGRNITVKRTVKGEDKEFVEFVPDIIWLATNAENGQVVRSYWIPKTNHSPARWAGLATGEQPLAWHEFFVPVHPKAAPAVVKESEHFIIDDCGGGA